MLNTWHPSKWALCRQRSHGTKNTLLDSKDRSGSLKRKDISLFFLPLCASFAVFCKGPITTYWIILSKTSRNQLTYEVLPSRVSADIPLQITEGLHIWLDENKWIHITLLMRAFTIFTETKMHLVQPPKILHNHCFQFLLGITAVQTDNDYANLMGGTRCIMVSVKIVNCVFFSGRLEFWARLVGSLELEFFWAWDSS